MADNLAIFVEGPVVYRVARELGSFIDFEKLGDHLARELGFDAWRMRYFHSERSQGDSPNVLSFLDALSSIDEIDVIRVRARALNLRCERGHRIDYDDTKIFPNIINDMLVGAHEERFDTGVLVSGRTDFIPTVQLLDTLSGMHMATAFWSESRMSGLDLREAVEFIDLEDVDLARSSSDHSYEAPSW